MLNLTKLAAIIEKAEISGSKELFNPIQPKCRSPRCHKNSRCIKMSIVVAAKKEVYEMARDVKIVLEKQQAKRIEDCCVFMIEGEIGFYCEYHENHQTQKQKREWYDIITTSIQIYPVSRNTFDRIKTGLVYWNNGAHFENKKVQKHYQKYMEKLPNRYDINYDYVKKTRCVRKTNGDKSYVVWEDVEETFMPQRVFNKVKSRVGVSETIKVMVDYLLDDLMGGTECEDIVIERYLK